MDVDSFATLHAGSWDRLDHLARQAAGHPPSLTPTELEELVSLYGHVSTHLSYVRTHFTEPDLTRRLSGLLARAGASLHGTRPPARRSMAEFFTTTLPAAVWHLRPFIAASAALTFLPALVVGLWLTHSPSALHTIAPPPFARQYVNHSFGDYYHSEPALQFATHVYLNNVLVSLLAFAFGVFLCVPTGFVLVENGINVGAAAGLLTASGKGTHFWVLILPHGLVELTSVVLAGAAGLRLGWTLVDPGDRYRGAALAEEGRRAMVVLLGVVLSLGIAGAIEGTVTGSSLPAGLRVGLGAAAEAALLAYLVVMGRRAHARGFTGALGEVPGSPAALDSPAAPNSPAEK